MNNNKINRKSFFGKVLCGIGALFGIKSVAESRCPAGAQGITGTSGVAGRSYNPYNFQVNEIRDKDGKITQIDLIQENGLVFTVAGKNINILLKSNSNSDFIKPSIANWTSNTNGAPDFKSFDFDKELFFVK